jgi:hypothetical protein
VHVVNIFANKKQNPHRKQSVLLLEQIEVIIPLGACGMDDFDKIEYCGSLVKETESLLKFAWRRREMDMELGAAKLPRSHGDCRPFPCQN